MTAVCEKNEILDEKKENYFLKKKKNDDDYEKYENSTACSEHRNLKRVSTVQKRT